MGWVKVFVEIPVNSPCNSAEVADFLVIEPLEIARLKAFEDDRAPAELGEALCHIAIGRSNSTIAQLERIEQSKPATASKSLFGVIAPSIFIEQPNWGFAIFQVNPN
jgi:hypothetical protein